ncbi:MAG: hypothetical protein DMG93_09125 [Acidobacteria bacterium]|nr:MAG: hypothetical protein DMG93_09125 [Acidobacteriota bacterium]
MVEIADRCGALGEDLLDHAGACEMAEQWPLSSMRSKEIADEFVEWSTRAANYQLAASLPIDLFARFAP